MSNYWQGRERDKLYNKQLKVAEKQLAAEYVRCLEETKEKLVALYDEILASTADGSLLVSDLYKFNRYYDLINSLNANMNKLGLKEIEITEENLRNMYLTNAELIANELGFITNVNEKSVKNAIDAVWCQDGKHWSSRIWTNKASLQERVKNGMVDCIARGASKDELVRQLQKDMNVGFKQADRIARTELTYIQNQSTYDKYREAGVEKYRYLATDDSRTSEICSETDGKVFLLKDASVGVNYPPLHPNCRCTVLAVL